MKPASPEEIKEVLKKHEPTIKGLCDKAWEEWLGIPKRSRFSKRSRASMYFDILRRMVEDEFREKRDVKVIPKGQTMQVVFQDKVVVRFKKANRDGLGSNIQTMAVLQFIDAQSELPGILAEHHRVEICYRLNKLETQIETVSVNARDLNTLLWSYVIDDPAAGQVVKIAACGVPPAAPDVRPKHGKGTKPNLSG